MYKLCFLNIKFGFNCHHYGIKQLSIFYSVNINDKVY